MVLKILTFPDPRLREIAKPVSRVTPELKKLSENMLETMYESSGIGLAAPQVGELVRLLVLDTRPQNEQGRYEVKEMTDLEKKIKFPIIIFNPQIVSEDGKTTFDEGCLSVPSYYETVERSKVIEVKGLDENGQELVIKTDGLTAICLQHEMDHLEGTLFIDHLSLIKSNRIKNQIKKHGYPEKKSRKEREEEKQKLKEKELVKK